MENYVRKETDEFGHTRYFDEEGRLHRTDGPAFELLCGDKEWFLHGIRHRADGPAVLNMSGSEEWWLLGYRHRTDGPAVIVPYGHKAYYIAGKHMSLEEFLAFAAEVDMLKRKPETTFTPKYRF